MRRDSEKQQGTECDELRDLLPSYVIGATTAEEAERVRALIPLCPESSEQLAIYGLLSDSILHSVEAVEPPSSVKMGLMARLAEKEGRSAPPAFSTMTPIPSNIRAFPTPEPTLSTAPSGSGGSPRTGTGNIWRLLSAAAAILLVATNVYWLSQNNAQQAELSTAQNQLAASRVREEDALTLMSNIQTQRVGLQSTDENLIPLATIYWNPDTNEAALVSGELPALEDQQTYQLWLIDEAGPHSAGTFDLDENGWGWLTFAPGETLSEFDALGISVEPEGGSEQPTTQPLAVGQVSI